MNSANSSLAYTVALHKGRLIILATYRVPVGCRLMLLTASAAIRRTFLSPSLRRFFPFSPSLFPLQDFVSHPAQDPFILPSTPLPSTSAHTPSSKSPCQTEGTTQQDDACSTYSEALDRVALADIRNPSG